MSPRISDLLAHPDLGLTVHAGHQHVNREIHWVATSEHEDPTRFLQGGELLLTTGILLPRSKTAVGAYVDRLARAGVVGLGLGIELVHQRAPARLVRVCEAAELVLLEVDLPTPFVAVSKTVSDLIAAEQYREVARANRGQQDITRTAVRDGTGGAVRSLARFLSGWAAVTDVDGDVAHAHPARARHRVAELTPELDRHRTTLSAESIADSDEHVTVNPLGPDHAPTGFLFAGCNHTPTATDRSLITVATALLSFGQSYSAQDHATRRQRAAILTLARTGTVTEPELLDALGAAVLTQPHIWVLAAAGSRTERASWAAELERWGPTRALIDPCEHTTYAALASQRDIDNALATATLHPTLRVGVSAPLAGADGGLPLRCAQADRALHLAISRGLPALWFTQMMTGAHALANPAEAAAFAATLLSPLHDYRARTGIDLRKTLTVWLQHHGRHDPAATELGLHRHTLRHRTQKAEQLLDSDLNNVDTRMNLWFALQAEQRGSVR